MTRLRLRTGALLCLLASLAAPAAASAGVAAPQPRAPLGGAIFDHVPAFQWSGVAGVDHYQFQIAADANFGSAISGIGGSSDSFATRNTYATLAQQIPDGTHW